MCLYTNQNTPTIASEDITCYKVVNFVTDHEKSAEIGKPYCYYAAPFQNYVYNMDTVLEATITMTSDGWIADNSIHEGFHSLETIDDAIELKNDMIKQDMLKVDEARVVKCIIPKGSEYYTGAFHGMTSFASNAIILISE